MPFSSVQCGVRRHKRVINALEVNQWLYSHSDTRTRLSFLYVTYFATGNVRNPHWRSVSLRMTTNYNHYKYFDELAFRARYPFPFYINQNRLEFRDFKIFVKPHVKRHYAILLGPTCDVPFCTEPFSSHNLRCAYLKRITPMLPLVNPIKINLLGDFVSVWLKEHMTPLPHIPYNMDLVEKYLTQLPHFNNKKKNLLRKDAVLICNGILQNMSPYWKRIFLRCKSFVKREFYELAKNLRFINSRSNLFKILVGPYMKIIEHQLFRFKWFVKGRIISDLPKDIIRLKSYPYFLETDYTSFESSFSPVYVEKVEYQLWQYMFQFNPEILKHINSVYVDNVHGHIKPHVDNCYNQYYRMQTIGTRMSGEMWTSLANSFSNLMNIMFICKQKHISYDGFVEGDDGLFGLSSNTITPQDFADLGFIIKMKYTTDLSLTSFCGNMFSLQTLHPLVSLEQLSRVFVSCSAGYLNVNDLKRSYLLRAKAMSLYCIGKYTPIVSSLAYNIMRILGPGPFIVDPGESWWNYYIIDFSKKEQFYKNVILMEDRLQYFKLTGISIQCQEHIESIYDNARSINELVTPRPMCNRSYVSGLC